MRNLAMASAVKPRPVRYSRARAPSAERNCSSNQPVANSCRSSNLPRWRLSSACSGVENSRLGQGNAALLGHDFHGFGKADVLDLLHEGENIARLVAAETMVELAHRVHGKGCGLFPVKGTKADVVLASGFFQRDVFADDADDVRLLLYELSKV